MFNCESLISTYELRTYCDNRNVWNQLYTAIQVWKHSDGNKSQCGSPVGALKLLVKQESWSQKGKTNTSRSAGSVVIQNRTFNIAQSDRVINIMMRAMMRGGKILANGVKPSCSRKYELRKIMYRAWSMEHMRRNTEHKALARDSTWRVSLRVWNVERYLEYGSNVSNPRTIACRFSSPLLCFFRLRSQVNMHVQVAKLGSRVE